MAQDTVIQGSIWSKDELVTAINKQPDGFIVKNWKGITFFIHNSLLKSYPNKNEELKEVNHNNQTFEKLTNEADLAKMELLQSQKIIQDLERRFAEGESKFKTIDDRVQNYKKMEKEQKDILSKEICMDIKFLSNRFTQHTAKLTKYQIESKEDDMTASEESKRVVTELRKRQEELIREYEGIEKAIVRGGLEGQQFPLFDILAHTLIDAETTLNELEVKATPKLSCRKGDLKTFSLSVLVNVSIRIYQPGASFAEWINQILNLRKSNRVSEEVTISKALQSMDKFEPALKSQLLSRNFTTFLEFEEFIYDNLSTPDQLVTPLL